MEATDPRAAALIVAHPGHELRVYGWLEQYRPVTFVLTRGDGHVQVSRVPSTLKVLEGVGAVAGEICGRFSDTEMYAALLRGDIDQFLAVVDELVEALSVRKISLVGADAAEGYNPSHDVCSYLVAAAVSLLRRGGHHVEHFEFPLIAPPDTCPAGMEEASIWLQLDDETFDRKMGAARNYPELAQEVARAVEANGAHRVPH